MHTLYAVHARSIIRKSSKDPGKLGVWLVFAQDAASARVRWRAHVTDGTWTIESISEHAPLVTRVL